jgi:MoaA/NifB/PqqE/SkfB family radical SAM enzyme
MEFIEKERDMIIQADSDHSKPKVGSMLKVGFHKEKIKGYLEGKNILPVTLELDLTSECTRVCPECPSANSPKHHSLSVEFAEKLFAMLECQTPGLLLTGGEPTLSPIFSRVLEMARRFGFREISVVTNGDLIDKPHIAEALLKQATTIRLSIYDWEESSSQGFEDTLRRIESLRHRIDREGSELKIGTSALTSRFRINKLVRLVELLQEAGTHWIYLHPLCSKWALGSPELAEQDGVILKIEEINEMNSGQPSVFFFRERYQHTPLNFKGYHASNFLLVVGADGFNYLAPEVKYQSQFIIADFNEDSIRGTLWETKRQNLINSVKSRTYSPLQSRNRGILYSHFIEGLINQEKGALEDFKIVPRMRFLFPHIL